MRNLQKSLASKTIAVNGLSLPSLPFAIAWDKWYAAPTPEEYGVSRGKINARSCAPVIPDPIIHISASEVKAPSLPSFAKGFASGAESIQKDFVGFGTGRWAGECEFASLSTPCASSNWFRGIDEVGIPVDNQ